MGGLAAGWRVVSGVVGHANGRPPGNGGGGASPLTRAMELLHAKHVAEAEAVCRAALAGSPRHPAATQLLGLILMEAGRDGEALALLRQSVRLRPRVADFHNNLGALLARLGLPDEAATSFAEAIRLDPGHTRARLNLAAALRDDGRPDEALGILQAATADGPARGDVQYALGVTLRRLGRSAEAAAALERAARLLPDDADVHRERVAALGELGRTDEAIASLRRVVDLRPDWAQAHSDLLFTMLHRHGDEPAVMDAEAVRYARRHGHAVNAAAGTHTNDRSPDRRLRVGYVSPDFRWHPVATFFEAVLARRDRQVVDAICYTDVRKPDSMTRRLLSTADGWRDVVDVPDARLAEMITADRIDVLVDLAGHTGDNRLGCFAFRPAPVQIAYLGYPETTGLEALDAKVTDAHLDLPGWAEQFHVERLVRLPDCCWCYTPPDGDLADPGPPPATRLGHVTFGSLNRLSKVTPAMIGTWSRVLHAVPLSRMVVLTGNDGKGTDLVQEGFAQHGIDAGRVQCLPRMSRREYLEAFAQVDVALDTYPYAGQTVTCNALWMGVPTVTLAGRTHVSRAGVSVLANVGLPELIAQTSDEYVEKAVALARDEARLAGMRAVLRERMRASPLCDGPRLARALEQVYRMLWREWCERHTKS